MPPDPSYKYQCTGFVSYSEHLCCESITIFCTC